jgi:hypothetical protein
MGPMHACWTHSTKLMCCNRVLPTLPRSPILSGAPIAHPAGGAPLPKTPTTSRGWAGSTRSAAKCRRVSLGHASASDMLVQRWPLPCRMWEQSGNTHAGSRSPELDHIQRLSPMFPSYPATRVPVSAPLTCNPSPHPPTPAGSLAMPGTWTPPHARPSPLSLLRCRPRMRLQCCGGCGKIESAALLVYLVTLVAPE